MRDYVRTLWFDVIRAWLYGSIIILMLIGANIVMGDRQQRALDDINNGTRAMVCVLALPVDAGEGRDQALVDQCLLDAGIKP